MFLIVDGQRLYRYVILSAHELRYVNHLEGTIDNVTFINLPDWNFIPDNWSHYDTS